MRAFGGLFNGAEQREPGVRSLPTLSPQACTDKESGLVSAKADLPSCVYRLLEVRRRCVRGLNSWTIPLSSGGFVLVRLSLTFLEELGILEERQLHRKRRKLKMKEFLGALYSSHGNASTNPTVLQSIQFICIAQYHMWRFKGLHMQKIKNKKLERFFTY